MPLAPQPSPLPLASQPSPHPRLRSSPPPRPRLTFNLTLAGEGAGARAAGHDRRGGLPRAGGRHQDDVGLGGRPLLSPASGACADGPLGIETKRMLFLPHTEATHSPRSSEFSNKRGVIEATGEVLWDDPAWDDPLYAVPPVPRSLPRG